MNFAGLVRRTAYKVRIRNPVELTSRSNAVWL